MVSSTDGSSSSEKLTTSLASADWKTPKQIDQVDRARRDAAAEAAAAEHAEQAQGVEIDLLDRGVDVQLLRREEAQEADSGAASKSRKWCARSASA